MIDERLLIHSFQYQEYGSSDRSNQPTYKEPVQIEKCRIDFSSVYSRDNRQNKVVADAVIFCYATSTTPFMPFKERSKVVIGDRSYTIQKVIPVYYPYENALFSYELEVL